MGSRDVELDLIGHDHTGNATRSAANNLDQLRHKMAKFNADNLRDLKRDRNLFARSGIDSARAFTQGFIRTVSLGMLGRRGLGGPATGAAKVFGPAGVVAGLVFGAKLLAAAGDVILAGLPLLFGGAILAGPFIHLWKTQKPAVDKLKAQWKGFADFVSKPLKLPFLATLKEVGRGLDNLKKPFASLVKDLGPALKPFTRGVFDGIVGFVKALKPAMPGITAGLKAWGTQLPVIGKAFGDMLAKLLKDPKRVTKAVENTSKMVQDIITLVGDLTGVFLTISDAFAWFGNSALGLERATQAITTAFYSMAIGAVRAISGLLDAWATINPLMRGPAAGVHALLAGLEASFGIAKAGWIATAATFRKQKIVAKIEATITDLETKIAAAKAKLKTVHNAKARAKIEATIKDLEAKAATAKRRLLEVKGAKTEAKIKATIAELVAKTAAAKAKLKTVHNAKTQAKIKAEISQLQAAAARARAELASIHSKTVTVRLNTVKTTTKVTVNTTRAPPKGGPVPLYAAGDSWSGAAGGSYRTGGASPINVEAPIIDTRVFVDGQAIRSVARSTVVDENRRAAHRARVGRR